MNNTVKRLKASIKQLAEKKVRTTQERVEFKRNASPEFRQSAEYRDWFEPFDDIRDDIRYDIRNHLLAYALVRGRPYKTVERKCREGNKPWASSIQFVLENHTDFEVPGEAERLDELIDSIEEWLDTPATESPSEATEAAA